MKLKKEQNKEKMKVYKIKLKFNKELKIEKKKINN